MQFAENFLQLQQKEIFNPILTGLFESKFLLGGGGQFDPPPLQISAPKGPIAAKFCMDVKTHVKTVLLQPCFGGKRFLYYVIMIYAN